MVAKRLRNGRAPLYPARWWAHLVGALRAHPHEHDANFPLQKDPFGAPGDERSLSRELAWISRVGKHHLISRCVIFRPLSLKV